MADDECDLEALLDVLDEDDDGLCASAVDGKVESRGEERANYSPRSAADVQQVESREDESGGEEEEEIQRQLLEMEAKMRAMKEKLSKKSKSGGISGQHGDRPPVTAGGDANRPLKTADSESQRVPKTDNSESQRAFKTTGGETQGPRDTAGGDAEATSSFVPRPSFAIAEIDFRNGKSRFSFALNTIQKYQ